MKETNITSLPETYVFGGISNEPEPEQKQQSEPESEQEFQSEPEPEPESESEQQPEPYVPVTFWGRHADVTPLKFFIQISAYSTGKNIGSNP